MSPGRKRTGIEVEGANLDFESGNLDGWSAMGEVWEGSPTKGDTVTPRRPGQASNHHGQFWQIHC
jgi:hypothetical protein